MIGWGGGVRRSQYHSKYLKVCVPRVPFHLLWGFHLNFHFQMTSFLVLLYCLLSSYYCRRVESTVIMVFHLLILKVHFLLDWKLLEGRNPTCLDLAASPMLMSLCCLGYICIIDAKLQGCSKAENIGGEWLEWGGGCLCPAWVSPIQPSDGGIEHEPGITDPGTGTGI